jgi:hypothetical protein
VGKRTSEGLYSAMATQSPSFRLVVAASALLTAAACSSKNPDTLVGKNLDENAAMMDANASVAANLAGADASQANAKYELGTTDRSGANATSPAKPAMPAKPPRHSGQASAIDNNVETSSPPNDVDRNQVGNDVDMPNAMSEGPPLTR